MKTEIASLLICGWSFVKRYLAWFNFTTLLKIAYFLYSIKCEILPRIVLLQSNFEVAECVVWKARNVKNIPERI